MKKIVLAVLVFLLVIGIVYFVRINQNGYDESANTKTELLDKVNSISDATNQGEEGANVPVNTPQTNSVSSGKMLLSDLSKHDKENDCWISYKGKVYDITSYLPRHPGTASKIMPYCGSATEFENAFTKKHGTSKVDLLMKVGVFIGDFDVMGEIK